MGNQFSVVGKSMPDVRGVEKVTGVARFISDTQIERLDTSLQISSLSNISKYQ